MTSLNINTVSFKSTGYSNYFRGSEVAPTVEGDTLTIIDGYGERRYWGTPKVDSRVSQLTEDVIKVEVTGWHKHTVSPVGGNYYFVREGKGWTRRTANHKRVKAALAAS
jgi:hypothetical protein